MAAMYNNYVINSAFIRVQAVATGVPMTVAVMQREETGTFLTATAALAQPGAKNKASVAVTSPITLTHVYKAKNTTDSSLMNDSTQIGTTTTNPSDTSNFTIAQASIIGTGTHTGAYIIDVWYNATWFNPKTLSDA